MHDLYLNLRLDDVQTFLVSGYPSLISQLGCILALWIFFFVYQRLRKRRGAARHSIRVGAWIFFFACFAIISEEQWLPFVMRNESMLVQHFSTVLRY